jgi:hypothetical protein
VEECALVGCLGGDTTALRPFPLGDSCAFLSSASCRDCSASNFLLAASFSAFAAMDSIRARCTRSSSNWRACFAFCHASSFLLLSAMTSRDAFLSSDTVPF